MGFYKAEPLAHFTSKGLGATVDFSETTEGFLAKRLLVLVEGTHVDSKKRVHNFPRERIVDIAERSNTAFENGARIPLLTDHNKTQFSTVGDLDSPFEIAVITEENLPNPRHRHLLGKLGIFAERAIIKSQNAIDQAKRGLLSTISPGIDPVTNIIKEISFTPTPAIDGLMAFKNHEFNSQALSFDELEQSSEEENALEEQYENLTESLWTITTNAMRLTDDDQVDPQQVIEQALQDFADRYLELIGMGGEEEQSYEQQQVGGYPPQQSVQGAAQPPMAQYNRAPIAAFSMAELEHLNNAEFGRGRDKKNGRVVSYVMLPLV